MQEETKLTAEQPRNPITHARYRREVIWQILFPLAIGVLGVLGLAGGLILLEVGDASLWADISLIWLITPLLIVALIPLAVLLALVYLVALLIGRLPPYAFQAQRWFADLEAFVRQIMDRAVEPILRVHSSLAAVRSLRKK